MVIYFDVSKQVIDDKYDRGVIDYWRYCFLFKKLTEWVYVDEHDVRHHTSVSEVRS